MDYDYQTMTSNGPLECKDTTTGQPFTPDAVFYRNVSKDFPTVGAGAGATIMVGPVYRATKGALKLPAAFDGKLMFGDWGRSYMWTVDLNAAKTGVNPSTITPFAVGMPSTAVSAVPGTATSALPTGPASPIAFKVGPDGAVYVAEYGSGYYVNGDSKISRLVCKGCQPNAADYGPGVTVKPIAPAAAHQPAPSSASGVGRTAGLVAGGLVPLAVLGLVRRRRMP
jgi:hypothetical protein